MMANIPAELNRFCTCSKRLRTILTDTKRCFDDINEDGRNEIGEPVLSFQCSSLKEKRLDKITFLVFHQNIVQGVEMK